MKLTQVRNRFKARQYSAPRKRKRYENDLTLCERCNMLYDLDTENHLAFECPHPAVGEPILIVGSSDNKTNREMIRAGCKRKLIKFMSHEVYDPPWP